MNNEIIERNKAAVAEFLQGTHSANPAGVEVIDRTVHPDIVCHGFPGGDPVDRASYKAWFTTFRGPFSDMDFQVLQMVADTEYVAVRWSVAVPHSGPFAGVPATGRRVEFEGMVLYRMVDGLIAETWLSMDQLALLSQIGAISAPSQAA